MKFTGFLFDSLKIESKNNKWASRLLFIVVFAFSSIMRISPPGDPDLSSIIKWINNVEKMSGAEISQISLPDISRGNVIYLAASFIVAILFVIFIFISTYIFFSDHTDIFSSDHIEENQKYSFVGFLRRLPSLLAFILLLLIPVNFLAQYPIFLMLGLFIISSVYLSPAIILIEKSSALESMLKSVKKTFGLKLSIFMNILTIYSLYQIVIWLILFIINENSVGFYLVDGFLFAFLVIAIGKNIGAFYKITKELTETV